MLTRPGDVQDAAIVACLAREYGLPAARVTFLPLGADVNTAVYRAEADEGQGYLVKLRRGAFDEVSVTLPRFLRDQGIAQVIPPLPTTTGRISATLGAFQVTLYPFVEGRNGYEIPLSERQWRELGAALRALHSVELPAALGRAIQQETYTPQWRDDVKAFLERVDQEAFSDPVAAETALLLQARREEILYLVGRAEALAGELQARPPQPVLCHADVHAGNVLLTAGDNLYLIDWDTPIVAFKERDLMSIGGGLFGGWQSPEEEERLFYEGYGFPAQVDASALAYYRYERIIQDIAAYCAFLLLSGEGGQDREQSLRYLESNFQPGGTVELAYRADAAASLHPARSGV